MNDPKTKKKSLIGTAVVNHMRSVSTHSLAVETSNETSINKRTTALINTNAVETHKYRKLIQDGKEGQVGDGVNGKYSNHLGVEHKLIENRYGQVSGLLVDPRSSEVFSLRLLMLLHAFTCFFAIVPKILHTCIHKEKETNVLEHCRLQFLLRGLDNVHKP